MFINYSAEAAVRQPTLLHGLFTPCLASTPLVIWGEILIGLTPHLRDIHTRRRLLGRIMMMLYYLALFPPAQNPWMDEHLVYILLLGLLGALGAGRILGLDAWIERLP